jgi:hypothetical protein
MREKWILVGAPHVERPLINVDEDWIIILKLITIKQFVTKIESA